MKSLVNKSAEKVVGNGYLENNHKTKNVQEICQSSMGRQEINCESLWF